jgi:hypothetical protein
MQWGMDKADELGLPAYLEGSIAGVGLYESVGFVPEREIIFDATKYGGEVKDVHLVRIFIQAYGVELIRADNDQTSAKAIDAVNNQSSFRSLVDLVCPCTNRRGTDIGKAIENHIDADQILIE